jgi:hypothetical protein
MIYRKKIKPRTISLLFCEIILPGVQKKREGDFGKVECGLSLNLRKGKS